jgi:hypothetical protein
LIVKIIYRDSNNKHKKRVLVKTLEEFCNKNRMNYSSEKINREYNFSSERSVDEKMNEFTRELPNGEINSFGGVEEEAKNDFFSTSFRKNQNKFIIEPPQKSTYYEKIKYPTTSLRSYPENYFPSMVGSDEKINFQKSTAEISNYSGERNKNKRDCTFSSVHNGDKKANYRNTFRQEEKTNKYCNNCGKQGHIYSQCKMPITSYGIIAFRYNPYLGENEYLMVCRQNSFGFIDFMRGKYSVHNKQYICNMVKQMTVQEKKDIITMEFDDLWKKLWKIPTHIPVNMPSKFSYDSKEEYDEPYENSKNEGMTSKDNFNALKKGIYKFKFVDDNLY